MHTCMCSEKLDKVSSALDVYSYTRRQSKLLRVAM
jgi:hypothetical protein